MRAQLRPYQQQGVADIRQQFADGRRAVLFVLPTGGGKTYTYAFIAESSGARGKRVLILEHRKELIRQASLSLANIGVRHQVVAPANKISAIRAAHVERAGWPMIERGAHVAVASVQTLGRRMEWLAQFDPDLIVVDEAHHAVAGTWKRIIEASPRSRLLGVTATPVRTDGQGLGDVFDSLVVGPSVRELIELGALVPPRVFAPPVKVDLSQVHMRGGDYDARELTDVLDKPTITGDAVQHYAKLAPGRPAIVFCASIKHAEHVAAEFCGAGFRFAVIKGDMDDAERDRLIYGLADGRLHGLVSVDVVSEGTDIPVAEVAILLRPTQSEGLFLQQVGRVLRPAEGKEHGLILDHVGNTLRHGLPDGDRSWTLAGRKKRKRAAANDEPSVPITQCPQCYAVHEPASKCPVCGHQYQAVGRLPTQVDGELREVGADPELQARIAARRAQAAARTVQEMVAATGMSEARARHILEARAEKERLQQQVRDLLGRWWEAVGRPAPAQRAAREAFGFGTPEVLRMKPKQLRQAVERVTEEILRLQLGAPANDNGFSIRSSA